MKKTKYKYYLCKENGIIYKSSSDDKLTLISMMFTHSAEWDESYGTWRFETQQSFNRMFRPISYLVVKFFMLDKGYNNDNLKEKPYSLYANA